MFVGLVRAMRPHQWVKNLFVLTPLVFAKELFSPPMALRALGGFVAFSLLASAVYIINDINDIEGDRVHATKRKRPIASGEVPVKVAASVAAALAVLAIGGGALLSPMFAIYAGSYLALNVAYTHVLKRMPYIDVLCIALGFELRVLAGAAAAVVPASAYLLLVTFLLALFLGLGKRKHELLGGVSSHQQRSVLSKYDPRVVNAMLWTTAVATVGTYVVYTLDPTTHRFFGTSYLVVTSLFAVAGIGRFLYLAGRAENAESPTEQMLRDLPFLANLVLWGGAVVAIIYAT